MSARKPPIGTKWSFFEEKTAPSLEVRDRADDLRQRPVAQPGSRSLTKTAFSEMRVASRISGTPYSRVSARTLAQVLDRERLSAGHVQAGLLADERDAVAPARPASTLLERVEVDVALEREGRLRVGRLGHGDVDPDPAGELDVHARGREVEVRGDELARLDEHAREQVLGAAALVRRDQVAVAVDVAHGRLEPEEAARAGVRLVAELHRGALLLRERRGAAVREQVDEDVLGAEQERVVAGRCERGAACLGPTSAIGSTTLIFQGGGPAKSASHLGESLGQGSEELPARGGSVSRRSRTIRQRTRPPCAIGPASERRAGATSRLKTLGTM